MNHEDLEAMRQIVNLLQMQIENLQQRVAKLEAQQVLRKK